jgi:hypothetical protein
MPRLELILLHSASADGYNARRLEQRGLDFIHCESGGGPDERVRGRSAGVSAKTARRDVAARKVRGMVGFVRPFRIGKYRLNR